MSAPSSSSPSSSSLSGRPSPDPRPAVQPGQLIAGCRLEAVIGLGAWSTVFRARDASTGEVVVVKVLSARAPAAAAERFRREVHFAARLAHPGFCPIRALVQDETPDGPVVALVMDLVDGRTLGDVMNEGPMPVERAVALVRALSEVVAVAHARGVVHGDLKPGNVMVRRSSSSSVAGQGGDGGDALVVLDFGAATADDIAPPAVRVGSLHYLAPELFSDQRPSPPTDVWALGVILYGCLTGRFPFEGDDERGIALAARAGRPPPPSSVRPGVPPLVDDLVACALTPSRRARPQDAGAYADVLGRALVHLQAAGSGRKQSPWQRLWRLLRAL